MELGAIITQSIENGLQNAKEMSLNDGKYKNSLPHYRNDCIFNELDANFTELKDNGYEIYSYRRGCYSLPLIYDREERTLYSILSINRYNDLVQHNKDKHVHYFDAFVTENKGHKPIFRQTRLFDFAKDEEKDGKCKKVIDDMRTIIDEDKPINYYVVVFKEKDYNLLNVDAKMLTEHMELIDNKDWSQYIGEDYSFEYTTKDDSVNNETPVEVSLKRIKGNQGITLKKEDIEKEGE